MVVGWQEWVALPELGLEGVSAKLDTGAFLSSLHVERIKNFRRNGCDWVRFDLGGDLGQGTTPIRCEAPIVEFKRIQSSSGHRETRPVIETLLQMAGFHWTIELSLTCRSTMQFPLLIGRRALAGRCLVDSGRIHLTSSRHSQPS
jgi:hypothetical protein